MAANTNISVQRILQLTEDADGNFKDFFTESASEPLITAACNVYASGKFQALGNQAPVMLPFTNVAQVVGWVIEASGPFMLWVNGGPTVNGGFALPFAPIGAGLPCIAGPNDCAVTSLQVIANANYPIHGRYCVYGTSPTQ